METQNQTKTQSAEIRIIQAGQSTTIQVEGVIDENGATALKSSFEGISLKDLNQIIFDFRKVTYIGSAGLGKLLLFYKKVSADNISMTVDTLEGTVRDVLIELKLNTLFTVN